MCLVADEKQEQEVCSYSTGFHHTPQLSDQRSVSGAEGAGIPASVHLLPKELTVSGEKH